jgi:hypothetical protein
LPGVGERLMITRRRMVAGGCLAAAAAAGCFLSWRLWPGDVRYAWLAFGSKADVNVLVTLAGDTITLQRFAGGEPVGLRERFKDRGQPLEVALADPDGVTTYTIRKCASPHRRSSQGRAPPRSCS